MLDLNTMGNQHAKTTTKAKHYQITHWKTCHCWTV